MLARRILAGSLLSLLLLLTLVVAQLSDADWQCPDLQHVSCSCDLPHTLRCISDRAALPVIARTLRGLTPDTAVSLLDITVRNLTSLQGPLLDGVMLHGLVISSGEIREVSDRAFVGLREPLQALGLPNNQLEVVPTNALRQLAALDRLDLSHNRITSLDASSFKGLANLTFLDLNDNKLINLTPDTFTGCHRLAVLRLRGNRLGVSTVSTLVGLEGLSDLDLSTNALVGPLGSTALPKMPLLNSLKLANNQFSSVRRGAFKSTSSLLVLSLNHNQIDVLEDHAFVELSSLRSLDLASNRIVAVSGASLAHLTNLTEADLSHNFLRALTADLIVPLTNLRELRLDDNDISMVTSDALTKNTRLERLTLSDNPLNCDCALVEFAEWFNNSSRLSMADRSTAVCVTPPVLENALLMEIPPSELRCGEDEDTGPAPPEGPMAAHVPLSGAQVMLRAFHFDGISITLLWTVDSNARPFACDALFVYEEMAEHEILLSSTPLRCNSSQLADPTALTVRLPSGNMQPAHRYRYCVVLLEGAKYSDEMQLVLGCSEVIALVVTSQSLAQPPRVTSPTHIAALQANVSVSGLVTVTVQLWNQKKLTPEDHCHVTVTVFVTGALLAQHHLNCTQPRVTIPGLPLGPYHICATLGNYPPSEPRVQCITVKNTKVKPGIGVTLTVCFVLLTTLILLGLYLVIRKIVRRPKIITTHQCFLAPNEVDETQQHSRYVKLQATTKL